MAIRFTATFVLGSLIKTSTFTTANFLYLSGMQCIGLLLKKNPQACSGKNSHHRETHVKHSDDGLLVWRFDDIYGMHPCLSPEIFLEDDSGREYINPNSKHHYYLSKLSGK